MRPGPPVRPPDFPEADFLGLLDAGPHPLPVIASSPALRALHTVRPQEPSFEMVDTSEKPFTLSVPEADLELLRKKLELVRLPDELDGANWDYGAPLADIKRLVTHWKDSYDWRKSEAEINKLPMFTRDIEVDGHGSLNIHYIHQKSEVKNAIPLLFVHGWPGDFLEVRKMLPLLTAKSEGNPSFHVVALSLPGFGFSEAPKKPGFAGAQYAEVFNKLMLALGYDEYVYQGGDWGYILGLHAVTHYAHKHIKAWHTNMPSCVSIPRAPLNLI
ncbi:hypothetical protein VTO73DRAFT_5268 [Trametes versicolor]